MFIYREDPFDEVDVDAEILGNPTKVKKIPWHYVRFCINSLTYLSFAQAICQLPMCLCWWTNLD